MPSHLLLFLAALTLGYGQHYVLNGTNISGGNGGDGGKHGNGGHGGVGLVIGSGPDQPQPPVPTTMAPLIAVVTSAPSVLSQDSSQGMSFLWALAGAAVVLVMLGLIYVCRRMFCVRPPPFDPPKLPEDTNDRYTPFVEHGATE